MSRSNELDRAIQYARLDDASWAEETLANEVEILERFVKCESDRADAGWEHARQAEAELKEWQVLRAWGGTPEIVEQWIKGQQVRIHHAQDIEESLAEAEARVAELENHLAKEADGNRKLIAECERLEAQNARLREALERIAEMDELDPALVTAVINDALADTKGTPTTADQIMRDHADHAFEKFNQETKGTP